MPTLVPGFTYEQKVVTVANNDTAINAEITTQAADDWTVSMLVVSGSDMVILFCRNVEDVLP